MAREDIYVSGARANNLKNVSLSIPRDKLVIFTGLSGSGKSSLAFDTIYAEGNRRFVESLSSYARMFLGQLDKPDVDRIDGLSPAISIDQKTTSRNPRSTVGTVTEIYDYLRLLYARIGVPHCPICGREIKAQSVDQITDRIMMLPRGTRFQVLAPVVKAKKGTHEKVFADASKDGFVRCRVDGFVYDLDDPPKLEKNKKHDIEIVIDRLVMSDDIGGRLAGSIETAFKKADDIVMIELVDKEKDSPDRIMTLSGKYACPDHDFSIDEPSPRMFSFNNPAGACDACSGIGITRVISPEKVIPNMALSLSQGAVVCNGFKTVEDDNWTGKAINLVGEKYGFTIDTPLCDLSEEALNALLYGTGDELYRSSYTLNGEIIPYNYHFRGIIGKIQERFV